jgi:hypothetical protein
MQQELYPSHMLHIISKNGERSVSPTPHCAFGVRPLYLIIKSITIYRNTFYVKKNEKHTDETHKNPAIDSAYGCIVRMYFIVAGSTGSAGSANAYNASNASNVFLLQMI